LGPAQITQGGLTIANLYFVRLPVSFHIAMPINIIPAQKPLRYFFHIGYNGFNYRGWQKFPDISSVQQVLETNITLILKIPVSIVCCGRTDAQVHASQFFFHVDIEQPWDFDLLFRLNKNLPPDIAVFDIIPVEPQQHARFDASLRTYDYFIHNYKDPFLSAVSSFYPFRNPDLDKMKEAASLLLTYRDYKAFCKTPLRYRTTFCEVSTARWFSDSNGDKFRFQIAANRFLGNMVRIIVGKMLQIGNGTLTVEEFERYLISGEAPTILQPAYPQGLFLSKVTYPYLDITPKTNFLGLLQGDASIWQPA
jgi:tRNA pseudouridine38-40 synthase